MRRAVRPGGGWWPRSPSPRPVGSGASPSPCPTPPIPTSGLCCQHSSATPGSSIVDAWAEAPAGVGPGPVAAYLASLTGVDPGDDPVVLPPLVTVLGGARPPGTIGEPGAVSDDRRPTSTGRAAAALAEASSVVGRRRPTVAAPAAPTPTRSSPTTWPTPPAAAHAPGPPSSTAPAGDEARLACAFVADVLADLAGRTGGARERLRASNPMADAGAAFVGRLPGRRRTWRRSAASEGARHLDADFELVRETFHRFAEEQVRPRAEHIHRTNGDIPEEIIAGLAELGALRPVGPRGVRRVRHRR